MKSLLLLPILLLSSLPVQAYGASGSRCYEEVWREEYVPGTFSSKGYVRRWQEEVEVACRARHSPQPVRQETDDNSCLEGSILGGIAGGAGGAALSRDQGRFIGIPLGIVAGALIGCQIDGG